MFSKQLTLNDWCQCCNIKNLKHLPKIETESRPCIFEFEKQNAVEIRIASCAQNADD